MEFLFKFYNEDSPNYEAGNKESSHPHFNLVEQKPCDGMWFSVMSVLET